MWGIIMNKHKWHKEIKAWADGAEIETKANGVWKSYNKGESPLWYEECEYRIKPQPKEPQYLYVYINKQTGNFVFELEKPNHILEDDEHKYVGKIKLEQDDE